MITAERLRELLYYGQETGVFRWRVPRQGVSVGDVAGGPDFWGYWKIGIDGKKYAAHRLAWLYVHGAWPTTDIDHIDRRKSNNAIENLRVATDTQNLMNAKTRSDNRSGYKGVCFEAGRNKWRAGISIDGRYVNLGRFSTPEVAHAAYCAAATKHYGEFACFG